MGCFFADCLLENGVAVLSCKVGDKLYVIRSINNSIAEVTVRTLFFNQNGTEYIRTTYCDVKPSDFGESVFFTREEAEEHLKK